MGIAKPCVVYCYNTMQRFLYPAAALLIVAALEFLFRTAAPAPAAPAAPAAQVSNASEAPSTPSELLPTEFLERLLAADEKGVQGGEVHALVDQLQPGGIREVLNELARREQTPKTKTAVENLISKWMASEPAALKQWVARLPQGTFKSEATINLATLTVGTNPIEAVAMIKSLEPHYAKTGMAAVFFGWAFEDPVSAAAHVNSIFSPLLRREAGRAVVSAWAAEDPEAAVVWVSQLPADGIRSDLYSAVFRYWMRADRQQQALDYISKMPAGTERTQSIETVNEHLMHADPSAALQLANLLLVGEKHDAMVAKIASQWMQTAPEKALAWAKSQTDERVRAVVWPAVALGLSASDPCAAAQMLVALPQDNSSITAMATVAARWAEVDAPAAAVYLKNLPGTDAALATVVGVWAGSDPQGASRWLDTLPSGPKRDAAVQSYVSKVFPNNPADAAQSALGISDRALRTTVLSDVTQRWLRTETQAATRWIEQLPSELRQQLQIK